MAKSKRGLSDEERAERRRADRERMRVATEALLSSEGWQRWVRARAVFHRYSLQNSLLLAYQCHARGITPRRVAGFRAWLKLGRVVRKGERALKILAPMPVKERDEHDGVTGKTRVFFRTAFVFADVQTEPLPGVQPAPLEPPSVPIDGDSHGHLLEPLAKLAAEVGFSMSFAVLDGQRGGFCDYQAKRIVIEDRQAPNAKVRVAIHELAHALGVSSERFGRERAEVIVECAAFVVAAGLQLETGGESIPYVAGWGEDGALDAVSEAAELIDEIARRIEDALADYVDEPSCEVTAAASSPAASGER
jgi:antirestriction protein ArdC